MKIVRESIDFRRGEDPKSSIGIGKDALEIKRGVEKYGPLFKLFYECWLKAKDIEYLENVTDIIYTGDVKNTPDPLPEPFFDFDQIEELNFMRNPGTKTYRWRVYLPRNEKHALLAYPAWKRDYYTVRNLDRFREILNNVT